MMMNEDQKLKEMFSALLDGEAGKIDQLELRRLARALEDRPELVEVYRRFTLTRAVMKGDRTKIMQSNVLLTKVRAAIDGATMDEATFADAPDAQSTRVSRRWLWEGGRVAIAASVAFVAIYLVQVRSEIVESQIALVVEAAPVVESPATVTATAPAVSDLRFLNPDLLTVSAGDHRGFNAGSASSRVAISAAGCVISPRRVDNSNAVWEKKLPEGYVICKKNSEMHRCELLSSVVGCYRE